MRHGVLEQTAVAEAVVDRSLQRLELVTETDHPSAGHFIAVAVDDVAGLELVGGVHGDAHFAELVDRQRKHGVGHAGGDERPHAVDLEQSTHDARLDVGMRAEDDDELAHDRLTR